MLKSKFLFFGAASLLASCGDPNDKPTNVDVPEDPKTIAKSRVQAPPFNADSAFSYINSQVKFGPRTPGGKSHELCAQYLEKQLKKFGAEVIVQKANVNTFDGKTYVCKNIIGSFNKDKANRVLLASHWDSRPFADRYTVKSNTKKAIDGANDGASGVGVLLEMARQMHDSLPDVGVDIVFFDVEDYGDPKGETEDSWCLGAQYWAKNPHVPGYTAKYGILLDMVGAKDAVFPKEGTSMYYAENIMNDVWKTAQDMGFSSLFVNNVTGRTTDDHLYVNEFAHIPMIDMVHYDPYKMDYFPHHHRVSDTMQNIDKGTLQKVGSLLMSIIYNEI